MDLIKQFQNLLDPSNSLGAFIISLIAGIVTSFFGGYKVGKYVKKNSVDVNEMEGDILQDIKNEDIKNRKVLQQNEIRVNKIKGNIKQDSL